MKLFATSLLAASAINFAAASTCQNPLVSNGQCTVVARKAFKNVACSSKSATGKQALKITSEGKLCAGGKRKVCLTRRFRGKSTRSVFRMSKKITGDKMEYVIFNYDAANNQFKVTAPNGFMIIIVFFLNK